MFFNSTPQHGNLDNPNHNAYAHNWRNKDAAQEPYTVDWTQVPDRYKNTWPNGAYPQYMAETPYYPNYVAGQPRYPNEPYREGTSGTLGGKLNVNANYTHEHIYLDRDDFTAIRQHKSVRPLKNPVPNGWKWTLEQYWTHQVSKQNGTDQQGNPVYVWDTASIFTDAYDASKDCGNACPTTPTADGQTRNWKLAGVNWKDPKNQTNGQQGEFRGPHYDGWREELQSGSPYDGYAIRYSDERIWKPGTPGYKPEYEKKFGANLIWWSTQDSAFENWATLEGWDPRARRVDNNVSGKGGEGSEDLAWGAGDNKGGDPVRDRDIEIQPTGDITNGLIRVGDSDPYRSAKNPGRATLGEELKWDSKAQVWRDHHNTKTRIFGHYHLAYADQEKREVKPVSMNSYLGVRSFVAQVKDRLAQPSVQARKGYNHLWADLESQPNEYSIGAVPNTLKHVQYGRVTTKLDLADSEGPFKDGFLRAPLTFKNDPNGVDHYFFRGTNATSIEQMGALPSNAVLQYSGHALMYGINNSFHGLTDEIKDPTKQALPNAFAFNHAGPGGDAKMGLGNFVDASFDVGAKKVTGDVYNAWLQALDRPTVLKDKLVHFQGDVIGNTVLGTADRTYIVGDDEATFRAAFFGKEADEMGGSFNSVKPDDKYGSAYEIGDWGGVFGSSKTGGGSNNTFQGDDGANNYGNTNVAPANNYNQ